MGKESPLENQWERMWEETREMMMEPKWDSGSELSNNSQEECNRSLVQQ
jgi:hypothetical protein